jgi:hypothetical protein
VLAVRLERVGIEEGVSLERNAGDQSVVERALHHVDVLAIAMEQELAMIPVVHSNRGAGLVVGGHVRKVVRIAKALVSAGGADAASEVELRLHQAVPDAIASRFDLCVIFDRRDVGHP